MPEKAKDLCVKCGKLTPYDHDTPLVYRVGYVGGSGQWCIECVQLELKGPICAGCKMPTRNIDIEYLVTSELCLSCALKQEVLS